MSCCDHKNDVKDKVKEAGLQYQVLSVDVCQRMIAESFARLAACAAKEGQPAAGDAGQDQLKSSQELVDRLLSDGNVVKKLDVKAQLIDSLDKLVAGKCNNSPQCVEAVCDARSKILYCCDKLMDGKVKRKFMVEVIPQETKAVVEQCMAMLTLSPKDYADPDCVANRKFVTYRLTDWMKVMRKFQDMDQNAIRGKLDEGLTKLVDSAAKKSPECHQKAADAKEQILACADRAAKKIDKKLKKIGKAAAALKNSPEDQNKNQQQNQDQQQQQQNQDQQQQQQNQDQQNQNNQDQQNQNNQDQQNQNNQDQQNQDKKEGDDNKDKKDDKYKDEALFFTDKGHKTGHFLNMMNKVKANAPKERDLAGADQIQFFNEHAQKMEFKVTDSHKFYRKVERETQADACAWAFTGPGKFEKYFYLHPALFATDVRIRITYTSLCHSDTSTARGKWGPVDYPICAGHEIIGEVIAVGPAVTQVKVGDVVAAGPTRNGCMSCPRCLETETNMCIHMEKAERDIYGLFWGGYSTHVQLAQSHVFKLPSGAKPETAAPILCAGLTMYKPLVQHCKKGQKIAIMGAGGLGHIGVQIANKMGMTVDVFCSKAHEDIKKDHLIKMGADRVIPWDSADLSLFQNTYDVILNTIPEAIPIDKLDDILKTVKPMGKFVVIGLPPADIKLAFKYETVVTKSIQICGTWNGGIKMTNDCLAFCVKNNVEPMCEFYSFDDFPKALEKAEFGIPLFRCVVNVDDYSRRFKH